MKEIIAAASRKSYHATPQVVRALYESGAKCSAAAPWAGSKPGKIGSDAYFEWAGAYDEDCEEVEDYDYEEE